MITEVDLLKLRYKVITRLEDSDNSVEFIHQDFEDRTYLVKLRKGEVNIVYPSLENKPCFKSNSLEELIAWHYHY